MKKLGVTSTILGGLSWAVFMAMLFFIVVAQAGSVSLENSYAAIGCCMIMFGLASLVGGILGVIGLTKGENKTWAITGTCLCAFYELVLVGCLVLGLASK